MPINFGLLQPMQQPRSGIIANIPNQSSSGANDFLSPIMKAIGAKANSSVPNIDNSTSNPVNSIASLPNSDGNTNNITDIPSITGNNSIFDNANKMMGINEHDPIMKAYLQKANPGLDPSLTPWCAGYVGSVLNASGLKGTGSLAARSYLNYGDPTNTPSIGDVVVLSRGSDPNKGHVGFYAGRDSQGNVRVLGGNQDDSVGVKAFPSSRVLGFRVPPHGSVVSEYAQQNNIGTPEQLANMTNSNNNYSPENIVKAAKAIYPNNPVMAKLAASQAFLESGLSEGKPSKLALKNNLFGIKGSGTKGSESMPTTEYVNGRKIKINQNFATNNSLEDSFKQHSDLLNRPRYKDVMGAKTFEDAASAISKAGYATDPTYTKQLMNIYNNKLAPYFKDSESKPAAEFLTDMLPKDSRTQPQSMMNLLNEHNATNIMNPPKPQFYNPVYNQETMNSNGQSIAGNDILSQLGSSDSIESLSQLFHSLPTLSRSEV